MSMSPLLMNPLQPATVIGGMPPGPLNPLLPSINGPVPPLLLNPSTQISPLQPVQPPLPLPIEQPSAVALEEAAKQLKIDPFAQQGNKPATGTIATSAAQQQTAPAVNTTQFPAINVPLTPPPTSNLPQPQSHDLPMVRGGNRVDRSDSVLILPPISNRREAVRARARQRQVARERSQRKRLRRTIRRLRFRILVRRREVGTGNLGTLKARERELTRKYRGIERKLGRI